MLRKAVWEKLQIYVLRFLSSLTNARAILDNFCVTCTTNLCLTCTTSLCVAGYNLLSSHGQKELKTEACPSFCRRCNRPMRRYRKRFVLYRNQLFLPRRHQFLVILRHYCLVHYLYNRLVPQHHSHLLLWLCYQLILRLYHYCVLHPTSHFVPCQIRSDNRLSARAFESH